MRLAHAIDTFSTYLHANQRSPHTVACYQRDLRGLARFAGDPHVADLTHELLHAYVVSDAVQNKPDGQPRAQATVNRGKAALRSFGSWLVMTGAAQRNPAEGLDIRRADRQSPSTFTEPERKRMLREVHAHKGDAATRDSMMLDLLLGTGIRLAELVGLDCDDVDLDRKRITIRAKGGHDETRFLNAYLRQWLRRYLRHRNQADSDSPALFLSNRGTRISRRQVQARFRLWLQWAGIDRPGLSVHSTRHTFASRLYRRSKDLLLVAKAMGHRTIEATAIYVHADDEALEEALESI